jgi:type II secretory pathway pseudopilin PulG
VSGNRVTSRIQRGAFWRSPDAGDVQQDRGVTIVELLVSMTLLSTVGVAVLVSVAASARGAGVHREVASVQAQLASVGDHLMSTDSPFRSCAHPDYREPNPDVPGEQRINNVEARQRLMEFYNAQVAVTFSAFTDLRVTDIQFWNGTDGRWDSVCWALFQGDRMQLITLQVIDANVGANSFDVVKRPPSSDEPTAGIVTPPPLGSAGGGGGGGGGSFATTPCIEGCGP